MAAAIETVGVVGAGFMGSGIAESSARTGLPVIVYEPTDDPLARSRERVERSVAHAVAGGKLQTGEATALIERIIWTTNIDALAGCDLAVEAVTEDPAVKTVVFTELDATLPEHSILASNTSSIPIAQLAAATTRRERVIGLHFFSPVPVMKLVELVVGIETSAETVERCKAFVERIGKRPIRTKDRSGFIVNMLLVPYLMAGVRMYEEGFAEREAIDEAMRLGCGHPMGPLELADFVGLDVLYAVCDSLFEEFKRPEYAPPPLMKRMVVSGHLGRKTGRGFYEYPDERSEAG
jgi:3-hydroxybutyryl-CoA dehydrogenase